MDSQEWTKREASTQNLSTKLHCIKCLSLISVYRHISRSRLRFKVSVSGSSSMNVILYIIYCYFYKVVSHGDLLKRSRSFEGKGQGCSMLRSYQSQIKNQFSVYFPCTCTCYAAGVAWTRRHFCLDRKVVHLRNPWILTYFKTRYTIYVDKRSFRCFYYHFIEGRSGLLFMVFSLLP